MKELTKYVCEYCGREYRKGNNCKKHEEICWKKPANKTCLTCLYNGGEYEERNEAGGYITGRECLNPNCHECNKPESIVPVSNCQFWEKVRTREG